MPRPNSMCACAAVPVMMGMSPALAAPIALDPSAVSWTNLTLPVLGDQATFIPALPTSGTVVYDNITPWRRGLSASFPESLGYQGPGNDADIWTSDDLHLGAGVTAFNEVHFVIRTFNPDRPISLAFWESDAALNWTDPSFQPAYEFSFTLPTTAEDDYVATLVTLTLPHAIDLGAHMWMGLQSIDEGFPHELIPFSSATPAVGSSENWWSQVPGSQMQNIFLDFPNNFAYGLSYTVPAPGTGALALLAVTATLRRRR